jgi:hypothetical protein
MKDWTHKLFSEGELTDYLIIRWERFIAAMNAAHQGSGPDKLKLEDNLLRMPEMVGGFKIVKHGFIDQDTPFSEPAFLESGLTRLTHPRSYIIVQMPFCGEADLFQHRPPDCPEVAPQGMVCGQNLHLKFERSGSDDSGWKVSLRNDLLAIQSFLNRADVCIQGFNECLRNMLASSATTVFVTPHLAKSLP